MLVHTLRYLERAELSAPARGRAEAVLHDLSEPVGASIGALPLPTDPRGRARARALLQVPADGRSLEAWGHELGASARTLSRVFAAETGVSFAAWRAHGRLALSLPHLADGVPVAAVARRVGYRSVSAFSAAFRRSTGLRPLDYATSCRHDLGPGTPPERLTA